MTDRFELVSPYKPSGDQPEAIRALSEGFQSGLAAQTLQWCGVAAVLLATAGMSLGWRLLGRRPARV